jgi:asparagine synthase (glutamine-hydrolysing)
MGALLSGGIDSSLVTGALTKDRTDRVPTFNVRFSDKQFDETWAAVAVAAHYQTEHRTLNMEDHQGTWDGITQLLLHAGQPFADTSIFACNLVCRLLRQHVTVALSGDGGDEGYGGYDQFWQLKWILGLQTVPHPMVGLMSIAMRGLAAAGCARFTLAQRIKQLAGADDAAIVQHLLCWIRDEEHRQLCLDDDLLPVRRWFEPHWERELPKRASRVERLSALLTEAHLRVNLPNCYLFKVDTASMKESLEVRVPMLDEDLIGFGLSLPHRLKATGRTSKLVLREVARRRLPPDVANKPKRGFGVPVDRWVDPDFKVQLRDRLLGPSSALPEFFHPHVYRPVVDAFCNERPCPGITRQGLFQRATMLLAIDLAMDTSGNCQAAEATRLTQTVNTAL